MSKWLTSLFWLLKARCLPIIADNKELIVSDAFLPENYQVIMDETNKVELGESCRLHNFSCVIEGKENNIVCHQGSHLVNVNISIHGNNNTIIFGNETRINTSQMLIDGNSLRGNFSGNRNILSLGRSSNISGTLIDFKGSDNAVEVSDKVYITKSSEFFIHGHGCRISLGSETSIQSAVLAATEIETSITVGNDNMWSDGVVVLTGDGHPMFHSGSIERINSARNIRIGDHVWLGRSVIVLKGACIGDGCVVGIGSIVQDRMSDINGKLLENSVFAGNPAKKVRESMDWWRHMIVPESRIEQRYPDAFAESWFNRGCYLTRKGSHAERGHDYETAKSAYRDAKQSFIKAIELKGDFAYAYCSWGNLLERLGRFEEAGHKYESAIRILPEYQDAIAGLKRIFDK